MLDICRNDLCKSVRTQMKAVTCFFELMKRSSLLTTLYEFQQNHSIRRNYVQRDRPYFLNTIYVTDIKYANKPNKVSGLVLAKINRTKKST
jgi:hypothetical protein